MRAVTMDNLSENVLMFRNSKVSMKNQGKRTDS